MFPLTKEERYRIKRLADRVRGLYRSEQQALHFIAEAQTMEKGVCSKSLKKHAADFGYTVKALQRGIHGSHRKGKLEYPGLLARRIAYVAGGYPHGGLAPGGAGLTPDYAINIEVMLTYIPEVDEPPEPPEKGDTKGDTRGDTLQKGATHRATQRRTSCLSSSLPPAAAPQPGDDEPPLYGGKEVRHGRGAPTAEHPVVVVGNRAQKQRPKRGQEKLTARTARHEELIARSERDRTDRKMTNNEIYREYKSIFDRLKREHDAWVSVLPSARRGMPMGKEFENELKTNKEHREDAARIFRTDGRDVVLAAWEKYLIETDHGIPAGKPVLDENGIPTGKFTSVIEERAWILREFVLNYAPASETASHDLIEVK